MASVTLLVIALTSYAGAPARGATPRSGAALAEQALSSQTKCGSLSSAQSVLIGQTVMTRMLGAGAPRNAMTAHMITQWSKAGLTQAYQFMGQRLAGCAVGNGPRPFGAMMGMMGGGMMGASYGYGTTGYSSAAYRPAYMMGGRSNVTSTMMGNSRGSPHHSGAISSETVAIGVGLLALVAAMIALTLVVSRRHVSSHPG